MQTSLGNTQEGDASPRGIRIIRLTADKPEFHATRSVADVALDEEENDADPNSYGYQMHSAVTAKMREMRRAKRHQMFKGVAIFGLACAVSLGVISFRHSDTHKSPSVAANSPTELESASIAAAPPTESVPVLTMVSSQASSRLSAIMPTHPTQAAPVAIEIRKAIDAAP